MNFHSTRSYHKLLYSTPYEIRSFMLPKQEDHDFYYLDLSNAELCHYANISGDKVLLNDILAGKFWDNWLKLIGFSEEQLSNPEIYDKLKPIIKANVYSIIYSLSESSMKSYPVKPEFKGVTSWGTVDFYPIYTYHIFSKNS